MTFESRVSVSETPKIIEKVPESKDIVSTNEPIKVILEIIRDLNLADSKLPNPIPIMEPIKTLDVKEELKASKNDKIIKGKIDEKTGSVTMASNEVKINEV